jgi:hypothetical protein
MVGSDSLMPVLETPEDRALQVDTADRLAQLWKCTITHFPRFSPIDWYSSRDGRLAALIELKCRHHPSTKLSTVIFGVDKWLALQQGAVGLRVPGMVVFRFHDGVFFTTLRDIDASKTALTSAAGEPLELVIEIPVASLKLALALDPAKKEVVEPVGTL